MKLAKSLLLASAAGFAAFGAQAADLPSKKAAPVEYVKVCKTYGAGFFTVPGTDSCLRVGGRARAELGMAQTIVRSDDGIGYRGQFQIFLDHRTQTEYGLLRSFVRFDSARRTGERLSGAATNNAEAVVDTAARSNGNMQTAFTVDRAFVQFGGLTAGRTASFFDNNGDALRLDALGYSDRVTQAFAYTLMAAPGLTATVAIEDSNERRTNQTTLSGAANSAGTPISSLTYASGQAMPEVVGNIRYQGGWGHVQLSGAYHEVRASTAVIDTEYGYAGSLSGRVNLPMVTTGSYLFWSGTYAKGAIDYVNPVTSVSSYTGLAADGYVVSNKIYLTNSWGLAAGLHGQLTKEVYARAYGAYTSFEIPTTARAAAVDAVTDNNNVKGLNLGAQLGWVPVSGLTIMSQVDYTKAEFKNAAVVSGEATKSSPDRWVGRIRIQRDF